MKYPIQIRCLALSLLLFANLSFAQSGAKGSLRDSQINDITTQMLIAKNDHILVSGSLKFCERMDVHGNVFQHITDDAFKRFYTRAPVTEDEKSIFLAQLRGAISAADIESTGVWYGLKLSGMDRERRKKFCAEAVERAKQLGDQPRVK